MRLYAGKKIGQSGYELVLSVFFSFFLHAAIVVLALILYSASAPKVYIPPFYEVKLVGPPAEVAPAPAAASEPLPVKAEPTPAEKKSQPKVKTAAPKPAIKEMKKSAMPELAAQKKKTARNEETKPVTAEQAKPSTTEQAKPAPKELASVPRVPSAAPATAGNKAESVEVKTSSGDPKIAAYESIIGAKIQRNWKYPEGPANRKVTVFFRVDHTGKVVEVKIKDSNADDWFERAAERAIWDSSRIPMPDGYYKDADFTVVLAPKE